MVKVGEYDEEFLLERAAKIVLDKTKDSTIFCEESEALIPTFASSGECCNTYACDTTRIFLLSRQYICACLTLILFCSAFPHHSSPRFSLLLHQKSQSEPFLAAVVSVQSARSAR